MENKPAVHLVGIFRAPYSERMDLKPTVSRIGGLIFHQNKPFKGERKGAAIAMQFTNPARDLHVSRSDIKSRGIQRADIFQPADKIIRKDIGLFFLPAHPKGRNKPDARTENRHALRRKEQPILKPFFQGMRVIQSPQDDFQGRRGRDFSIHFFSFFCFVVRVADFIPSARGLGELVP